MSNPTSVIRWHRHVARATERLGSDPLRFGYVEAILNSFSLAVTAPLVVPLAVSMGTADWQVGILTALPLLGLNVSQLPASRIRTASRHPRAYFLAAGGLGGLAWLTLGLCLLTGRVGLSLLLAVTCIASVSSGLQTPMWTAVLGGAVPEDRRGSYFGTRNLLAGISGLVGAGAAACLVSAAGFRAGSGLALMLAVICFSGAATASAWGATMVKARPVERGSEEHSPEVAVWKTPAVRSYVIYGAVLILGAGLATPYYSMRFVNELGGEPQTATTAIAVANATVMLGQGIWGRVIDRVGLRLIGGASLIVVALVPFLFAVASSPLMGVGVWLLNGMAWAACGLATFNLMLSISTDSNRATVVAWVNTLQSPVNFAAPLLGGLVAARFGLQPLFLFASLLILVAWLCFLRTAEGQDAAN